MLWSATAAGGNTPDIPPPPGYDRDIRPLLSRHCENCHGEREQHGGLRLDSYNSVIRGGDSGPVVVAGAPDASLLVAKVEHRDRPFMPPRKRLPKAVIARLRAWIATGLAP